MVRVSLGKMRNVPEAEPQELWAHFGSNRSPVHGQMARGSFVY